MQLLLDNLSMKFAFLNFQHHYPRLNYVHISQSIVVVVVQGVADLWSRCQVCDFALEICQQ
ncbi:hypothetical protein T08_7835 [Trichinella sp. T8]|nr:hypothetical protein T08_7835 [Trichinella sp. T8]